MFKPTLTMKKIVSDILLSICQNYEICISVTNYLFLSYMTQLPEPRAPNGTITENAECRQETYTHF
jgi:hypothetical protein